MSDLSSVNAEVSLGLAIANDVVIPVVKGIIKQIKAVSGTKTVEYTIVVDETDATLDGIIARGEADLDIANAELVRLGLPPLVKP